MNYSPQTKLELLIQRVEGLESAFREHRLSDEKAIEALFTALQEGLADAREEGHGREERIRQLELAVARFSERFTLWQLGQGAFSTVASALAVIVGRIIP